VGRRRKLQGKKREKEGEELRRPRCKKIFKNPK